MGATTRRLILLTTFSILLILAFQTGCDELITEQVFVTEAGHPTADFRLDTTVSNGIGCVPETVQFVDESTGPHHVLIWAFGDGDTVWDTIDAQATEPYIGPEHIYDSAGVYRVTLYIKDTALGGEDTETSEFPLYVGTTNSIFTRTPILTCPGNEVTFTPSVKTVHKEYSWDFGDGSLPVSGMDQTHVFSEVGTYTVTLTTTDSCGSSSFSLDVDIVPCPLVDIDADSTRGCVAAGDLDIPFHDASDGNGSNVVSWLWTFQGGAPPTASTSDPIVTYTEAGRYSVILRVTNEFSGTATDTFENYITVYDAPMADFEVSVDSACYSPYRQFLVRFTDNSIGEIDQWIWDFGDGTYDSVQQNPVHAYTQPGFYTVSLEVNNYCDTTKVTIDSLIEVADLLLDANVLIQIDTVEGNGDAASTFRFSDVSTVGVRKYWTWYVDDNVAIEDATVPQYDTVFTDHGTKVIKLEVSNTCGTATAEATLIVQPIN